MKMSSFFSFGLGPMVYPKLGIPFSPLLRLGFGLAGQGLKASFIAGPQAIGLAQILMTIGGDQDRFLFLVIVPDGI